MSEIAVLENSAAALASRFINHTGRNIFLTGKAGTGKTTFLKFITQHTHKKTIIAAPTGIAAINASGVTLHSLFQLPFGAFVPVRQYSNQVAGNQKINDPYTILQHISLRGNKRKLLQEMELLIIDEVSMLRADLLDAVDVMLRHIRRKSGIPFGGVQMLFIGDLMQLPPVIKDDEWRILNEYYNSPWFFEAHALMHQKPVYVELEKIYRQHDDTFINILNNLRTNNIEERDVEILNKYYKYGFKAPSDENYIYLTTHNNRADTINRTELQKLKENSHFFKAKVEGEFSEYNYPVEVNMELKRGAQVMFIKNDASGERKFFNGKIGKVEDIDDDEVTVAFDDGSPSVTVEAHVWENNRYTLNETTNEIDENVAGTFSQLPLRLAWAITIHKSQGLTFQKAIIDVGSAFAPGQVYVALSRLTSLDGLVLTTYINYKSIKEDRFVSEFSETKRTQDKLEQTLKVELFEFLKTASVEAFDFSGLERQLQQHIESYDKETGRSAKQKHQEWAQKLKTDFEPHREISMKFVNQLQNMFLQEQLNLEQLKSRLEKAKNHFTPIFKGFSGEILNHIKTVTAEKKTKGYLSELQELEGLFFKQLQLIQKAESLAASAITNTELTRESVQNQAELKEREQQVNQVLTEAAKREKKEKPAKGQSQEESYQMYISGKTIVEIAEARGLTPGTIASHLARFISSGKLNAADFVDAEKLQRIFSALQKQEAQPFGSLKAALDDDISYNDIRFATAEWKREQSEVG